MTHETTELFINQLIKLPHEQRRELAERLLESLHPSAEIDEDAHRAAWGPELERRVAQIDNGEECLKSADEVIARLEEKHRGRTGG